MVKLDLGHHVKEHHVKEESPAINLSIASSGDVD